MKRSADCDMSQLIFHQRRDSDYRRTFFSCDENGFSPSNLLVRKLFYYMLEATEPEITHFEVEYHDKKLADERGLDQATEDLRLLGASRENTRENRKEGILYSRIFRAELTPDRLDYFYQLVFLDLFLSLRFMEETDTRLQVEVGKTLTLTADEETTQAFFHHVKQDRIPVDVRQMD